MIKLIVLSTDRASQCDVLLSSIFSRFESVIPYNVSVVYHASNEQYALGYDKLQSKYLQQNIEFKQVSGVEKHHGSAYKNILNVARILSDSSLSKKKTNFKEVFESTLSGCSHIGLFTDECVIFKSIRITTEILNLISAAPSTTTFSTRLGMNVLDKPLNLRDQTRFCSWYSNDVINTWAESFSAKGNIYDAEFLIEFLRPLFYTNVVTLEKFASTSIRKYKALKKNYCFHRQRVVEVHIDEVRSFSKREINDEYTKGNELSFCISDKIHASCTDAVNVGFTIGGNSSFSEIEVSTQGNNGLIKHAKHSVANRSYSKV